MHALSICLTSTSSFGALLLGTTLGRYHTAGWSAVLIFSSRGWVGGCEESGRVSAATPCGGVRPSLALSIGLLPSPTRHKPAKLARTQSHTVASGPSSVPAAGLASSDASLYPRAVASAPWKKTRGPRLLEVGWAGANYTVPRVVLKRRILVGAPVWWLCACVWRGSG